MTALVWDATQNYVTGLDRGVLYPSEGPGVAWNGLTSVVEKLAGGEQSTSSADATTYLNTVGRRYFQATLAAFSTPREFGVCVGEVEGLPGFVLTRQPRQQFGFSYRTLIGSIGYKLHIVYNATAIITGRTYGTINDTPTPLNLEYQIDAVPVAPAGFRPSAHYYFDSRNVDPTTLATIEGMLYGTDDDDPYLPDIGSFIDLTTPAVGSG